ncbi:MAG: DUF4358 domain-containing protein [Clostridium sp.]|uniref:DUF4358 domain-containing protein n=1 Tax=Clostridium sp. TaxID=1506 RepID=UPI003EE7E8F1
MRKKVVLLILAVAMTSTIFVGCGGDNSNSGSGTAQEQVKDIEIDKVVENIKGKVELRSLGKVDDEQAKEILKLNLDDIEEYVIEKGMINTGLETIAIIKVKDGKMENVKKSLEEYKGSMRPYPNEEEFIKNAKFIEKGNYLGFFIIPDYEEGQGNMNKVIEEFENSFK